MKDKLKKYLLPNLPYLFFVYLFDKLCQAVRLAPGPDASEKLLHIGQGFQTAFASSAPSFHVLDICIGILGAVLVRLAVYVKGKNAKKYRKGIEYGSARWGTTADIAPYIDPVPDWNIPLTRTEGLTMTSRPKQPKYARNKNILVIGGSGSGKTRFFVKPSIMQMHSSYVITDPKGQLLTETGKMLLHGAPKLDENGKPVRDGRGKIIYEPYRIKVLNTINFSKSMKYNPLAYVRSEKDILKLVNVIIANTKGDGEKSSEDFWVKAERLLYCALIGYIWYEAEPEERNFITLLDLLNACEAREDDETYKSPVDILFDDLAKKQPDHFAVKQYIKFKMAAGVVCSKRLLNQAVGKSLRTHNLKPKKGAQVMRKNEKITALYERLSRDDFGKDDDQQRESNSISNQKAMLEEFAARQGFTNIVHFTDDGISGTCFDRPGFLAMMKEVEAGNVEYLCIKDLSRLGRNYIEVGRLTEEFFPNHDIRLVAVSDNIDTAEGENELAPIRNLFNEWYARDISKKRRISNKIKGNAGEPMGQPPYGYIKDPNDPKHWIVDDEAAQVVRRVYSMTLEGFGTEQIAAQLEKDDVLTPRAYWLTKGIKRPGKGKQQPPTKWNSSTITKILSLQEYCGDILNFKTYSKSYKNKKRIDNDRENWVVFQDVHEAIIERAVYEQVQQKRGKIRKRRTNNGEHNMFSGLLVCADCGSNLHFHFNQGNPEIKYFNCSNYKGNRGTCTSTHYVRVDFLEEVVLGEIRRLTKFASLYEDEFVKAVIGHSQQAEQTDRKLKEKELRTLLARDEELDGLFERIYEDNVSGKLSDDRFAKMSRRYEDEQKELAEKIKKLRSEIEKQSSRSMTTDMFIGLVRKYTRARKLTPRMLNELIEKIEVFNAEKIDGVWEQRLRIHYNCVGTIEIPTVLPLPIPEVSVNTRKGVVVNYAPCELAV